MDLSNLIAYYKDCYQADTRTLSLVNYFSTKVEHKYVVEGNDELLNGHIPYLPIPENYAKEVSKALSLYKKEKSFYAAAFFILGSSIGVEEKSHKTCAPLFLFPAEIVQSNGLYFVKVDLKKRILNINFLTSLLKGGDHELFGKVNREVPRDTFSFEAIGVLKRLLEAHLDQFNAEEILHYPQFQKESYIKKRLQPKQLQSKQGYHLVSSLAFGVLRKSSNTLGITSELEEMAKSGNISRVLRYLLQSGYKYNPRKLGKGHVPAVLNSAQESILESVNRNAISLVIGPPGTGKSYTIASLAIEFMSKGKSVLISSKTNQAVDVIGSKIEKDLGINGVTVRAGRKNYQRQLRNDLENLLSSIRKRIVKPTEQWDELAKLNEVLKENTSLIQNLEEDYLNKANKELDWASSLAESIDKKGLFVDLKRAYIEWRNSWRDPHWVFTNTMFKGLDKQISLIRNYIALNFSVQVEKAVITHRKLFRNFLSALSARHSSKQEAIFREMNFSVMLQTFPIWLVNMADIHDVLPMEEELFDLVIIDEATQCDIASCLPILHRAKRVVIVGDPKQLRHLSFLSESVQATLRKKHHLDHNELILNYRDLSILDLANNQMDQQDQIIFLNEHFRSNPDLISFSNERFYNDALRIMTNVPSRKHLRSLSVKRVNGIRNEGVNEKEGKAIVDYVKRVIDEQDHLDNQLAQSLGILSPFRDQVDYINSILTTDLSLKVIEKHNILCGTPYGFQGEERDIMLISLAIDDNSHPTAFKHMNKADVFNVAITRARSYQVIYQSFTNHRLAGDMVSKYLELVQNTKDHEVHTVAFKDQFLNEVETKLKERKLEYWVAYDVAGMMVDIVVLHHNKYYGINLIGFPGEFENALTITELKILKRAGLPTFPMPYTYWYFYADACFDEFLKFIEE